MYRTFIPSYFGRLFCKRTVSVLDLLPRQTIANQLLLMAEIKNRLWSISCFISTVVYAIAIVLHLQKMCTIYRIEIIQFPIILNS